MERISVRELAVTARHLREPVEVYYQYPRNHPLYGQQIDVGVFTPQVALPQPGNEKDADPDDEEILPP